MARNPDVTDKLDSATLENALEQFGYQIEPDVTASTLLASTQPAAQTLQWVREGGSLLYLWQRVSPFFWVQGRGGAYSGNWLRPERFPRLAVTNPLGLPFAGVAPNGVVTGLQHEDSSYHGDLIGGQFTGWVGHPAVHLVQFRHGKGKVLMATYNLVDSMTATILDPVAVAMFHDLVDYLASEACQPRLRTNV